MPGSPLYAAGGPKAVSVEAGAIIQAAVLADPLGEVRAALGNSLEQLGRFGSGDGLGGVAGAGFSLDRARFPGGENLPLRRRVGSRAESWRLQPHWRSLHQGIGLFRRGGVPDFAARRVDPACRLFGIADRGLGGFAVECGDHRGLSAPHERYQSRIMWLPPFAARIVAGCADGVVRDEARCVLVGLEAASRHLSVVASFAVARMVGPAELGIGAAAAALHVVLWVAVNALFADAVVQQAASISGRCPAPSGRRSPWMARRCWRRGGGLWELAAMLSDERLVQMGLVLSLPLPLVGARGRDPGVADPRASISRLALRTIIGQGAGTVWAFGCRSRGLGRGLWCWQQAAGLACAARSPCCWAGAGGRPGAWTVGACGRCWRLACR